MTVSGHWGTSPYRVGILPDGLQIGFVGRPMDNEMAEENPGSPDKDPDGDKKLIRLFGFDRMIIVLTSGHTGETVYVGEDCPESPRWHLWSPRVFRIANVEVLDGDAVVVNYSTIPSELRRISVVLRTRDCGNLLFLNKKEKIFAAVHASLATAFGYPNHFPGGGPIINEVLRHCGAVEDLYVVPGPSVAGIAEGGCWCYEFDQPAANRLFNLVKSRYPNLPLDNLRRDRPDQGKTDVAFSELLVRVLEQFGLTRRQIDPVCNHCTQCYSEQWYSKRSMQRQLAEGSLALEEQTALEQQMETGCGNLAFVHLT